MMKSLWIMTLNSLARPYEFEEAPATQFLIGTIRHIDIDELELQIVASG